MNLVFGCDQPVSEWASKKLDCDFQRVLAAIGVINEQGVLIGAAVLHHWSRFDVELSVIGKMTPKLLRSVAWVAYSNVERITLRIERRNKRVLRAAVKYGFKLEGTVRRLYGPYKSGDAIMFGMLRKEASRFLVNEGQDVSRLG